MEILCIRCEGSGNIGTKYEFVAAVWDTEPCPDCDGTGYLNSDSVEKPIYKENFSRYVTRRQVP